MTQTARLAGYPGQLYTTVTPSESLVRLVLSKPDAFDWSIQGFGMLRLYLPGGLRLHIWDPSQAVPDVTNIHDHPWDFESRVIWGFLVNRTYRIVDGDPTHDEHRIRCGHGAMECAHPLTGDVGRPRPVRLELADEAQGGAGMCYWQRAAQIHESRPTPGTVTVIRRVFHEDTEHALVYAPKGAGWVSAEPRRATPDEVRHFVDLALSVAPTLKEPR